MGAGRPGSALRCIHKRQLERQTGALEDFLSLGVRVLDGVLLIKPLAGGTGDLVCRHGPRVAINGRAVARASDADRKGRRLPHWSGCRRLTAAQVFPLSLEPDSFDGRYFGPLERQTLAGTALPVWAPRQTTGPGGVAPGEQRKPATPFGRRH